MALYKFRIIIIIIIIIRRRRRRRRRKAHWAFTGVFERDLANNQSI